MKKGCLCGFWNEAQQECLYGGRGYCIQDEWEQRAKEWEAKAKEWKQLARKFENGGRKV